MSTERVIQHQQCPHMSLLTCLDEKCMNCYFKYSFLLLLFITQKTNKQTKIIFCWQFTWNSQQMCNFLQLSLLQLCQEDISWRTSPWKTLSMFSLQKKSRKNRRSKREKPECILENSNKSTYKTIYMTVWTQQGRLYINLILRLQNGQLCFDVLAPGSIVGQEL